MHEEKCVRKTDPGGCVVVRLLDVRYGRRRFRTDHDEPMPTRGLLTR
jgi:hypothetical protein